ncbi:hypothetical protein NEIPOLOT_00157 [Neisseria polysaccharea ATCC 43768]|nr:hypothetical protein NEIPOLOT_00157 [Neisseria polysaccharea ATCC 43768]
MTNRLLSNFSRITPSAEKQVALFLQYLIGNRVLAIMFKILIE